MKQILFVIPEQYGYHTDTYQISNFMKDRFKVTFICPDFGLEKIITENIEVIYIKYKKITYIFNLLKKTFEVSKRTKYDILFVMHFKLCFLLNLIKNINIKILDIRTSIISLNPIKRIIGNFELYINSLFFKYITIISDGLIDYLNINKNKCYILPLGANITENIPANTNSLNLIYVGTLHKTRRILDTLIAVSKFIKDNKDIKVEYRIIGFGNKKEIQKINNFIQVNSMQNNIFYLGRIKYDDLHKYYKLSNIGVSYIPIKKYYDYQPATKTFEYLANGLIVIATDTYENRKIINDDNGVLCKDNPEDFYEKLKIIRDKINNYNHNKIKYSIENYTWQNITNNFINYLTNLVKK